MDLTVQVRCGATRARVLLRDHARAITHFVRGCQTRTVDGILHVDSKWMNGTAELVGAELRVSVHPRLPWSLVLWMRRRSLQARLSDFLNNAYGRTYSPTPYKVFCIGFQRTGTTSLHAALSQLGIFSLHGAPWLLEDVRSGRLPPSLLRDYDGFLDNPFPPLFRELDRATEDTRFILTVRDTERWLTSVRWLVEKRAPGFPMEEWLYGCPRFDRQTYRDRYERHLEEVHTYFAGRSNLLLLNVENGDGWEKLCPFLDLPIPKQPFPHQHRRGSQESDLAGPLQYGADD